ncbi:Rgg/GadR/MutR family transcriptional regulator [Streptococcus sp. X16XC17]|uniref:Rgg/GadR/MutR family transcriptional regulator n=1 Tax=unclassified Streptococcus TaxID=2608887 RepID=UPI00066FC71C|nr:MULTISPECIES: Rgg/GadR/MutR family transcriptional regulator [unclassified Streptococcus]TCD46387.1 Rgg/GadR/MutR family transcriptional regulator [Streptococcus sp. X16XC17]
MENIGKIFQLLRKSRNLSLDDLACDIISKSQISRFENYNVEISFIKLHYLVSKLHMSIDEFISHCNQFHSKKNIHYFQHLHSLFASKNFEEIRRLYDVKMNQLDILKTKAERITHALCLILLKTFLYDSNPELYGINNEEIQLLSYYLFSIEYWGQYEIYFLSQASYFVPYNTLLLLSKEIISTSHYYRHDYDNRQAVGRLAINSLTTTLEHEDTSQALYFIKKAELIIPHHDYLAQTVLIFCQGWLSYLQGDFEKGKERMQKSLHIFRQLDKDGYYQHFLKDYEEIISREAEPI